MRTALLNPRWSYEGSIYFGSRDPHLPLEHGYAKALVDARGHPTLLIDAHLMDLSPGGGGGGRAGAPPPPPGARPRPGGWGPARPPDAADRCPSDGSVAGRGARRTTRVPA